MTINNSIIFFRQHNLFQKTHCLLLLLLLKFTSLEKKNKEEEE